MSDAEEKLTAIRERAAEILLPDYFIGTTRRPLSGQKADDIRELCRWVLGLELPTPAVTREQLRNIISGNVLGVAYENLYANKQHAVTDRFSKHDINFPFKCDVDEAVDALLPLLSGATVAVDEDAVIYSVVPVEIRVLEKK